jgi:hypothetical protein
MIPLCALIFSCTSTGNFDIPQRTCMVAGIYVACDSIPKDIEDTDIDFLNDPPWLEQRRKLIM